MMVLLKVVQVDVRRKGNKAMSDITNKINMASKRILITGKNSFIGQSFENWLMQPNYANYYTINTIDTLEEQWKEHDFSQYDIVFHVAGIAHVDNSKLNDSQRELYYKVNRDLTINVAKKAKSEGVRQFIFMSSSIVFGDSSQPGKKNVITKNSIPSPSSIYGDSKLQADIGIHKLQADAFHVVSLRPPMIYGKGCKGNYPLLSKFIQRIPFFPDIKNERSMLHVDNLCEFIRLIIDNFESGYFYPQNREYISTSLLIEEIARAHGVKVRLTKVFNPFLLVGAKKVKVINKVFGSFVYDKNLSNYENFKYCVRDFKDSVRQTEL